LRIGGYRRPIVAMEHGFLLMMDAMAPGWRLARRLERRLSAPFVDVEVAVSDFMLERILRLRGEPRAVRIYNGVSVDSRPDLSGEAEHDGTLTFAHAARLIDGKGTDTLIEAFARSEARRSSRLVIAGDGPERSRLQHLAESRGVGERVKFAGIVADMVGFWSACDVAVLPSSSFVESFGMVAVEAMSLGKPVVATRNGGVPEVLGGEAGIVVDPGDPAALARALDRYAADGDLRHEHGARGRRRCEEMFSIEGCAAAFGRLFAELGDRPLPAQKPALEHVHA
jgi:glycosyltransferase involved in cell wall biosynthesis